MADKINRVVLAFSGGLDTSVILKWLQQTYACGVVTFTADLGHGEGLGPVLRLLDMSEVPTGTVGVLNFPDVEHVAWHSIQEGTEVALAWNLVCHQLGVYPPSRGVVGAYDRQALLCLPALSPSQIPGMSYPERPCGIA